METTPVGVAILLLALISLGIFLIVLMAVAIFISMKLTKWK